MSNNNQTTPHVHALTADDRIGASDGTGTEHASLAEHVETLGASIAIWRSDDDVWPASERRRSASIAVQEIDAMLRELHGIRERLTSEIRRSDVPTWLTDH